MIGIEDQFGNLVSPDNSTVVAAARSAGTGTLQGTLSVTAVNGIVTFAGLNHQGAGTLTIALTKAGLTSATSQNIVVGPAAASRLGVQTQPSATATAGIAFAQQPVVRIEDQFGNLIPSMLGHFPSSKFCCPVRPRPPDLSRARPEPQPLKRQVLHSPSTSTRSMPTGTSAMSRFAASPAWAARSRYISPKSKRPSRRKTFLRSAKRCPRATKRPAWWRARLGCSRKAQWMPDQSNFPERTQRHESKHDGSVYRCPW